MSERETQSPSERLPRALTIAGSDSSAGAGIQADLKTFAALGTYGLSALTAVTAQNTLGVRTALELPPELIEAQIDAVLEDFAPQVAKTGMLANAALIAAVADRVRHWGLRLVVDPVMVATSGAALLHPEAVESLRTLLFPLAEVLTPNIPEAEVLTGRRIKTLDDMRVAAHALYALGPRHVVIKGGHRIAEPIDVYYAGSRYVELHAERIVTRHTHGTGCTFSAAITALLARGYAVEQAVREAKHFVTGALQHASGLGHGHGPLGHFWRWEQPASAQWPGCSPQKVSER